jgi:hypothetical protein
VMERNPIAMRGTKLLGGTAAALLAFGVPASAQIVRDGSLGTGTIGAGLDSDRPDGRGDVCQCGEGDGTGQIDSADLVELRRVLARNDPVGDEDALARCSVSTDVEAIGAENAQSCNIKDLMDLDRALNDGSFPTGDGNVCLRAMVNNLPSI